MLWRNPLCTTDLEFGVGEMRPSLADVEGRAILKSQLSDPAVHGDRSLGNAVDQQGHVIVLDLHRQLVPVAGQRRRDAKLRNDLGRLGRRCAVIQLNLTTSHRSSINTPACNTLSATMTPYET